MLQLGPFDCCINALSSGEPLSGDSIFIPHPHRRVNVHFAGIFLVLVAVKEEAKTPLKPDIPDVAKRQLETSKNRIARNTLRFVKHNRRLPRSIHMNPPLERINQPPKQDPVIRILRIFS